MLPNDNALLDMRVMGMPTMPEAGTVTDGLVGSLLLMRSVPDLAPPGELAGGEKRITNVRLEPGCMVWGVEGPNTENSGSLEPSKNMLLTTKGA
jgi:hypothetical protein